MDSLLTRLHLIVSGRVQGVGYRWFVRDKAVGLKLAGWVRNRRDGAVEIEAEGSAEALKRFSEILEKGHPHARIEAMESQTLKAQGLKAPFEIRTDR